MQNVEVMQAMKRCFLFFFGLVLSIMCFVILEAQTQSALDSGDDELLADPVVTSASEYDDQAAPDLIMNKSL